MFAYFIDGFRVALQWDHLSIIAVSTFFGLWIGVIPGLGPIMAMALLFPLTFAMEPLPGLLMLASIHVAGTYSGSITAIMINVPGEAASAATTFDGYAMARQGKVRVALGLSVTGSFIGAIAGSAALILAAQPLVGVALKFGPAENFGLAMLGLCVVAVASRGSTLKGLLMGCLGLAIGFIGTDEVLGYPRFTFGIIELEAKVGFVPMLIGLFAIAELMQLMLRGGTIAGAGGLSGSLWDGVKETFRHPMAILRGLGVGTMCGIIPGAGAVTANLLAYIVEKKAARDPSRFGRGAPEGVIAPEVSNNACIHAGLIPTLALGLPHSAGTALVLVAVTVHGLRPGPMLFQGSGELVYGFFAGLLIGAVMFAAFGLALTRWFAVITVVPTRILAPALLVVALVGTYAYGHSFLDIIYAIVFGLIGFTAQRLRFPVIGLVMGLVLGSMAETNFHQALEISDGSYWIFVERPLSASIFALCALLLVGPSLWSAIAAPLRRSRKLAPKEG
jgi:putative tricarboxylic transport membrane protein